MVFKENDMTADQKRRVFEAIADCDKQIAREMAHREDLRDAEMIKFHIGHKAKLVAMLDAEKVLA